MTRGQLLRRDNVHWEAFEFRRMFPRAITPSDFDGWTGFVDLAGRHDGPLVVFELQREWAQKMNGQREACRQLRGHLKATDWWIRVLHTSETSDVWPHDVTKWFAWRCGIDSTYPDEQGKRVDTLAEFVRALDPLGDEQLMFTEYQ